MSQAIIWNDFLNSHTIQYTSSHVFDQPTFDKLKDDTNVIAHINILGFAIPTNLQQDEKGYSYFDCKYDRNEDAIESITLLTKDPGIQCKVVLGGHELDPQDISFISISSCYHDCFFRFIVNNPKQNFVQMQYTGYWFGSNSRRFLAMNPILTHKVRYEQGMLTPIQKN